MGIRTSGGVAVITGAGSGIGRALAVQLAEEGMEVVVVGRSAERLARTVDEIRQGGGRARAVVVDVSQRDQVFALADQVYDDLGRVDLLVLNAAVTSAGRLVDHTPEDWDWLLGANVHGVVHGIQAFLRRMFDAGTGHILFTGSQSASSPDAFVGHGPYIATKCVTTGLALSLEVEAAEHGVGVSLLIPGGTETDLGTTNGGRPSIVSGRLGADEAPSPYTDVGFRPDGPLPDPDAAVLFSPDEVARRAIAGIRNGDVIIASHRGMKPLVEAYNARVIAAYDRAGEFAAEDDASARPVWDRAANG